MGERHEGMKTALGGGSQHREKDVNDSGGEEINNAGLPLSLHPSVPFSLSLPSTPFTLCSHSFVYFSVILSFYCARSWFVLLSVKSLTSPVGGAPTNKPLPFFPTSSLSSPAVCRFEWVHQLWACSIKVFAVWWSKIIPVCCGWHFQYHSQIL